MPVIVFSYERSPFLYKNVMLHAWNSTSNTSIVIVHDHMKTIVEITNLSNNNSDKHFEGNPPNLMIINFPAIRYFQY